MIAIVFLSFTSFSKYKETISKGYFEGGEAKFNNSSLEKIYVHFDKSNYNAEEFIWFKVYLIDANTHAPGLSQVVYVEFINPLDEIVASKTVKIYKGCGEGDFKLPLDIGKGEYTVRAYTRYMQNLGSVYFFKKKLHINSLHSDKNIFQIASNKSQNKSFANKSDLNIQFFPEGGHLINGFFNRIGFKVVDENGMGVDLEGEIVDESNLSVIEFNTSKFGMGLFHLLPKKNKKYKARIFHNGVEHFYDFPTPMSIGVVMNILEYRDFYRANIQSSFPNGINGFKFIGKQRNGIVFSSQITGNKSKAVIKIPKDVLEQGIIQFTLSDDKEKPLSERLVFYESVEANPKLSISPSKTEYGKRELIVLNISLAQIARPKIMANSSMAVTEISKNEPEQYNLDIKTYLLLNSEIRGKIEQPGYYFNSGDLQRKKNLDILMMTQGWRRFLDLDTLKRNTSNFKFVHEKGITIRGTVKYYGNQEKPAFTMVSLSYKNDNEIGFDKVETDSKGRFIFKDLDFTDTTAVLIQVNNLNVNKSTGRKLTNRIESNYFIEIDSMAPPMTNELIKYKKTIPNDELDNFLTKSIKNMHSKFLTDKDVIQLEEVEIKSKRNIEKDENDKKRTLYKNPSQTLDFKELPPTLGNSPNPLNSLTGRVPGFSFRGGNIYLRGISTLNQKDSKALILLDGIPVKDASTIESIPFSEIDFIDLLKGPRAAIYGSSAAGGIIAVYTKDSFKKYNKKKIDNGNISFFHPGFSHVRKFYEPVYNTSRSKSYTADSRTSVLCWRPTIVLNEGKNSLSFYSANVSGTYQVILEGVTYEGKPIFSRAVFNVE